MNRSLFTICILIFSLGISNGQISTPPSGDNQKSVITQYIGSLVSVTITYNSPDVTSPSGQNRTGKIWGQLVPYGLADLGFGLRNPSPWRAGANENTRIEFSHDVLFEGQLVKAGTYGFHVIAQEENPWTIILSKNAHSWGSFFYNENQDVLRSEVNVEENEFNEWLTYEFIDRKPDYCIAVLMWENIKLPFKIEVPDINKIYVETLKKELQGAAGFTYTNWQMAANFCLTNNYDLEQGLEWAEMAISAPFIGQETFSTLQTKAGLLLKMERKNEAEEIIQKALQHPTATPLLIHQLGRQQIAEGNPEKAMKTFQINYDRFEGAWPTHVGMARGHSALGEYKKALKFAKLAYEEAPDDLNKNFLKIAIEKLEKEEDIN